MKQFLLSFHITPLFARAHFSAGASFPADHPRAQNLIGEAGPKNQAAKFRLQLFLNFASEMHF